VADAARRVGVGRGLALLAVVLSFGVLIAWPLTRLAIEAAGAGTAPFLAALQPEGVEAIGNSLWIAAAVTVLAVAGGLALAFLTEHAVVPGRTIMMVGILLPLLVPDFVSALG